jgi:hypothetical protein
LTKGVSVQIEVFDPAMCCSTGVCGPSVDPALAAFAADLDNLASSGVSVRRFNLGQEPVAFAENERVRELLTLEGDSALPVVFADGEFRSSGRYPTREELSTWTSTEITAPLTSTSVLDTVDDGACCTPSDDESSACCSTPEPVMMGKKSSDAAACC